MCFCSDEFDGQGDFGDFDDFGSELESVQDDGATGMATCSPWHTTALGPLAFPRTRAHPNPP